MSESIRGEGEWIVGSYYGMEGWSLEAHETKEDAIKSLLSNPCSETAVFKRVDVELKEANQCQK